MHISGASRESGVTLFRSADTRTSGRQDVRAGSSMWMGFNTARDSPAGRSRFAALPAICVTVRPWVFRV